MQANPNGTPVIGGVGEQAIETEEGSVWAVRQRGDGVV